MGCGPSSEVKGNVVVLVWRPDICGGLSQLHDKVPAYVEKDLPAIIELGKPYGDVICQMSICGQPCWGNPFDEKNEPLDKLRTQFPQYTFSFRAEFIGTGKHAKWYHFLEIRPGGGGAVYQAQVVGGPAQQQM
eukprot:symbB.v1.2.018325.t1/scaffold1458.1/size117527/4